MQKASPTSCISKNNYMGYTWRDNGVGASKLLQQDHQRASSCWCQDDEEDKALILLSSLPQSYDHIVTTMLYGKEALILEVTSTLLPNEIRKRSNQEKQEGSSLVNTGRKRTWEGKKGLGSSRRVTFITRKVIRRMTASICKSGWRKGKLQMQM